jgi:hypothetical protein
VAGAGLELIRPPPPPATGRLASARGRKTTQGPNSRALPPPRRVEGGGEARRPHQKEADALRREGLGRATGSKAKAVFRRWAALRQIVGHHLRVGAVAQHEALRAAGAGQHVQEVEIPGAVHQRLADAA